MANSHRVSVDFKHTTEPLKKSRKTLRYLIHQNKQKFKLKIGGEI